MPKYDVVESGDVLNYTTCITELTHGKLVKWDDWLAWQDSEYLQLDQYNAQGMFSDPVTTRDDAAIFHLVWTYVIKALDGRKKAQCDVCDGSSRSGLVQVLNETYANCVDQSSSRLFYAIVAAENLLIFGADISNVPRRLHQNKVSMFVQTEPSTSGGYNIRSKPQSHLVTLSWSFLPCKDTLNCCDFGKNMPTPSWGNLV